jgi:hypothetical protein
LAVEEISHHSRLHIITAFDQERSINALWQRLSPGSRIRLAARKDSGAPRDFVLLQLRLLLIDAGCRASRRSSSRASGGTSSSTSRSTSGGLTHDSATSGRIITALSEGCAGNRRDHFCIHTSIDPKVHFTHIDLGRFARSATALDARILMHAKAARWKRTNPPNR